MKRTKKAKKKQEIEVGDLIHHFDRDKKFRCGKVLSVGYKWVTFEDGEGKKKKLLEEIYLERKGDKNE